MLHINSKPIVEEAQIGNLNLSSIFSELITAATVCEYYASDLFYDLKDIEKAVENSENAVFYIGFRNSGVDGKNFVKLRLRSRLEYDEYIRLYKLEISVSEGYVLAELKRIDKYTAFKELCEGE